MFYLLTGLKRGVRLLFVMILVILGSTALVRYAPGYLSDSRELDSRYAAAARVELANEASQSTSIWTMAVRELAGALKGDLGTSRQFELPVRSLLAERLPVTANLLIRSILAAWSLSLGLALGTTLKSNVGPIWHLPSAILLALPTSVLTTLCLLSDMGGPTLVLTLILAVRDFMMFGRILRKAFDGSHVLQTRAQGIRWHRMLAFYVVPPIASQLAAVAGLSIVTALGAIIPVEVLFGIPGVGQLAWNAAMNRDLPVLLAVTALMAAVIASLTALSGDGHSHEPEAA